MTTVVLVQQGGTGSNNAADARGALGAAPSAAYDQANSAFAQANQAYAAANTGGSSANAAYDQANSATTIGQNAYGQANLAYAAANNSNLKSGGLISGTLNVTNDMIVGGNIYLQGNTTFINVSTYQVNDPLMYIAANNTLTDSVDIGFVGAKNTSGTFSHTGFARDATDGKYKLFDNLPDSGHVGNVIDFANTSLATLVANVEANTLSVVNGVTGNVNFDSGTLFVDSVGNRVGVGTTTPTAKLDIVDSVNDTEVLRVRTSGGNSGSVKGIAHLGLHYFSSGNNSPVRISVEELDNADFRGHLLFSTRSTEDDTAPTERMRIDANGNVGIGTTNPTSNLHVVGTANVTNSIVTDTANIVMGTAASYGKMQVSNNVLGTSIDNVRDSLRLATSTSNADFLDFFKLRDSAGSDWTTSGWRIQQKVDATWMGWIQFNGNGLQGGISFGTGTSTTSPRTISERMRINSSGNVGIGTSSPTAPLDVRTAAGSSAQFNLYSGNNSTNTKISIGQVGAIDWDIGISASSGNFYIGGLGGSLKEAYRIERSGVDVSYHRWSTGAGTERARLSNAGGFSVGTTADPGAGAIFATGDITAFYSDDRLKTKLGNIDSALSKVLTLNGFYFEPNETAMNLGYEKKKQVGVSAQEVQAVLPEVVVPAPIDQEYMTVHYHKIVPLLIEAIKELNEKIEKLTK